MDKGKAMRAMEITLVASLVVVFAAMTFAVVMFHRTDGRLKKQQIASCDRGNQLRRYVNRLNVVTAAGLRPIVIPDCADIIN